MITAPSGTFIFLNGLPFTIGISTDIRLKAPEDTSDIFPSTEVGGAAPRQSTSGQITETIFSQYIPVEKAETWVLTIKETPQGPYPGQTGTQNQHPAKNIQLGTWVFNFVMS